MIMSGERRAGSPESILKQDKISDATAMPDNDNGILQLVEGYKISLHP
jgi:hypothetical protein